MSNFVFNDGGRAAAGRKGFTGDCVCRSICIATGLPYDQVYDYLAAKNATDRVTKRKSRSDKKRTASHGVWTNRKWFKDYMRSLGFTWVPCMTIGSGCKVHLSGDNSELPMGTIIVRISKHMCCLIDRVIHDTYNPQRDMQWVHGDGTVSVQSRCVYGYWILNTNVKA